MQSVNEHRGTISEWNDARGFGFIDHEAKGRIFFHVRQFAGAGRPVVGDKVTFAIGDGRDGRPAAQVVMPVEGSPRADLVEQRDAPFRVTVRIVGALILATAIVCCVVAGRGPAWFPLLYVAGGAVSAALYVADKRAAQARSWRIAESTLHLVDIVFGIGGGLIAQAVLRHKSSKLPFAIVTGLIFGLHMTGLGALLAGLALG
jgi:uncharacterized membrane protein YsdA (DUF1294 family)/cold shock CspA family protein